jgi:hypothetical protein
MVQVGTAGCFGAKLRIEPGILRAKVNERDRKAAI